MAINLLIKILYSPFPLFQAAGITKELVGQVEGWMNTIIEIIKSSEQEVQIFAF